LKIARRDREASPREWAWAAGFGAAVMALTTLPYLVGFASQNDAWRFGGFLVGVEDGNSYLAKMGQGARGAWLFTLPYSSEPQRGVLIYEFYLLLGKLAGPDHTAQVVVYHLARIVFGFALLLVSYLFLSEFLPRVQQRRLALVLVALGGGLGWLLILLRLDNLFNSLPVDFYSPEAYTFLTLYTSPHLAAARCLLLLGLLAYLRGQGAWGGLALLGLGFIQPLYTLVAWVIMLADGVWLMAYRLSPIAYRLSRIAYRASPVTQYAIRNTLFAILLSSPPVLYTVYLFVADPLMKQWGAQNVLPSPHPVHYLFGYGVLLAPALFGWRVLARRRPALARFVGGWALAVPWLIYAPLSTQRRMIEGFQLPLVVLAVLGLTVVLRRSRRWLLPLIFALALPTSAMLVVGGLGAAQYLAEPVFHPADQLAAFGWLSSHAQPGQVVLSSFKTGNALPAYTPLVAYIGHGPETIFLAAKEPRVGAFYQSAAHDADRRALLTEGRIAFVVFGPHERALGDFNPDRAAYLRWRFTAGSYSIYEVMP